MRGSLLGGRYRIQNKIGEGGMAYVYVALDEKLQRKVAIKILHRHMADNADIRKRFFQEAQSISTLDHPNILKIFDFSGEESEEVWMVTEILQGVNLNEYTNSFPGKWLHPIVATIIVREILKALEKAHQEGLVHRDVKPENIMVLDSGKIKLMDFGIAKNTRGNSMTLTGTFMGSPSYMSPEQIRGRSVDQRSDLYSLGVLFYEIVTGKLPFVGNSTHDVVLKICEAKFKEPISIIPNLPLDMNKIILKAMSKYPSNRYQEARSFARDLDIFLTQSGFEESNIELERYFNDRDKFEDRLRALNFTNRASVTVAINIPAPKSAPNAEAARTKTHKTRVLSPEEQARLSMQQQNSAAVEKPKTAAQITWMQPPAPPQAATAAPRRDHQIPQQFAAPALTRRPTTNHTAQYQHTAMTGNFTHTIQHQMQAQRPGQLKKRRGRPRAPRKHASQPVVYRVSASSAGSDLFGLLAGIIIVGAVLAAALFGFVSLSKQGKINFGRFNPKSQQHQVQKPQKPASQVKKTNPATPSTSPVEVKPLEEVTSKKLASNKTSAKKNDTRKDKAKDKTQTSTQTNVQTRTNTSMSVFPVNQTETNVAAPTTAPTPTITKTPEEEKPASINGSIRISSQPAAEVYVDGVRKGTTVDRTASTGWLELKAGRYDLELRRSGYQSYRKNINVGVDQKLDLGTVRLTPSTSYELVLSASQQPVRVTVMNLSDRTQRTFTLDQQARSQTLTAGRYKVRFEYKNEVIERNVILGGTETRRNLSVTFE